MREIRLSGSEGGGTGNSTGSPYPYPRAQPGRIKTELTGASIVFGAGHARDESLDVPIVPQDFLPAWNIREY